MRISFYLALAAALFLAACAQPPTQPVEPPDTRAADEAAIRAASGEWAAAAQARDAEKFLSFYAEDARLISERAPDTIGKAAIRETTVAMMGDPNFSLTFETTSVHAARSGDIAYELGAYRMTGTDPETKQPAAVTGTFVAVWQKQVDGSWKCVVDAPSSDAPAPTPVR
ncbi:MAG: SgcJ/EcaC family oxidoreductase [Acidobacteriota bacterium]